MSPAKLIPILLLIPLLGGVGLAFLPRGNDRFVRYAALAWSLIAFALSLVIAFAAYGPAEPGGAESHLASGGYFFESALPWVTAFGLRFSFGLDAISLWLVLLTTFLMPIVIAGSFSAVTERVKEFFFWLLVLEAAMIGTFVATDLIFFYICFEFTLVPLYFLIGVYGSAQRLRAARVFFLYTFTGSMLTFAGVLYVAYFSQARTGEWSFYIPTLVEAARAMSPEAQVWVLLALLAGFAVKVPLFPVHTWLPLAHTEAPTAGSVILAGVLLKLGTYGLLRLAIPMTLFATLDGKPVAGAAANLAPTIAVFAIIGILYTALICWVQKDIKKLVAYSSVSHLGFCVLGMFALNTIGAGGSVLLMINHGLSTGALFLCIGMVYERFHTREMAQMGGLARVIPVWAFFIVFFSLASVGLPGLNGFVSEFLTLLGAFDYHGTALGPWYAVVAGVGMIFGAIYILYMVGKVVFGPVKVPAHGHDHGGAPHDPSHEHAHTAHPPVKDLSAREIATLVPLAVACLVLGLYPTPILRTLEKPLDNVVLKDVSRVIEELHPPARPEPLIVPVEAPTHLSRAATIEAEAPR